LNSNDTILQQTPFDIMAETYDEDFSNSQIGKLQREKVWSKLLVLLKSCQRPLHILELNCGTGEDAVRLASMGHHVVATDASAEMIKKAKQKINGIVENNLQFMQCSFEEINTVSFDRKFDLVFSNFGGLNCIDAKALQQLAIDLSKITVINSQLFFVVMGKFCLWETAYYLFNGKWKTAFRRLSGKADFTVNANSIPVYYYTPSYFQKLFQSYNQISNNAVGLFIPPSYLESFFSRHPKMLAKLNDLENRFAKWKWMSRFSDHYCITLKKK